MSKRARPPDNDFVTDFGQFYEEYNDQPFKVRKVEQSDDSDTDSAVGGGGDGGSSDEEVPNPALILPGGRIQIDTTNIDGLVYLPGGDPVYTASTRPGAGGRLSTATLGPGGYISGLSDADRSVIPAIVVAETHYGTPFAAGHLLNSEFGGAGDDADNLTILSIAANGSMRAFDGAIKNAVDITLKHAYTHAKNMGIKLNTLGYGIQLTITTQANFWSNAPGHAGYLVTNGVNCVAAIVGEPTQAGIEAALTTDYGTDRVNNHTNLMVQLLAEIANLQVQVAAANAVGAIPNP